MGSLELPRTQEISIFLAYHPWGVFVCILILLFSQSQSGCCLPGIASIIQEERRVKGKWAKESCQLFFPEKQIFPKCSTQLASAYFSLVGTGSHGYSQTNNKAKGMTFLIIINPRGQDKSKLFLRSKDLCFFLSNENSVRAVGENVCWVAREIQSLPYSAHADWLEHPHSQAMCRQDGQDTLNSCKNFHWTYWGSETLPGNYGYTET